MLNFLVRKAEAFTKDYKVPDREPMLLLYLETVAEVSLMMI